MDQQVLYSTKSYNNVGLSILLSSFVFLLLFSCKDSGTKLESSTIDSTNVNQSPTANKDSNNEKHEQSSMASSVFSIKQLYCYKLEKAKLMEYLDASKHFDLLTFKFSTHNILSSSIIFSVVSYGIKNPTTFPQDPRYELIQADACYNTDATTLYIIGNNYVKIKDIRDYIKGNEEKVEYLKLTPQLSKIAGLEGQIVFEIRAFDNMDREIASTSRSGGILTDPSPPAH